MKKKARWIAGIVLALISIVVLTQYQNCGQVGGTSPFSSLNPALSCNSNSQLCTFSGDESGNPAGLTVTTAGEQIFSVNDTSVTVKGTCTTGNFRRTQVVWTLRGPSGNVITNSYKALSRTSCLPTGDFSIVTKLPSNFAVPENRYTMRIEIQGLTAEGGTIPGAVSSEKVLLAKDRIPKPVLDSRLFQTETVNKWGASGTAKNILVLEPTTTSGIYNIIVDSFGGFCKYEVGKNNSLKVKITEQKPKDGPAGEADLTDYLSRQSTGSVVVACKPIGSDEKCDGQYGLKTNDRGNYNGCFYIKQGQFYIPYTDGGAGNKSYFGPSWSTVDNQSNSRHVFFTVGQENSTGTAGELVWSDESVMTVLRFTDPRAGRGWTIPSARLIIDRMKDAASWSWQSVNQPTSISEAALFIARKYIYPAETLDPNSRYGMRSVFVWLMGGQEFPTQITIKGATAAEDKLEFHSVMNIDYNDSKNLAGKMAAVVRGASCDSAVPSQKLAIEGDVFARGRGMTSTDDEKGPLNMRDSMERLSDTQLVQLQNIALCMNYWLWQGWHHNSVFEPNNPGKLLSNEITQSIQHGLKYFCAKVVSNPERPGETMKVKVDCEEITDWSSLPPTIVESASVAGKVFGDGGTGWTPYIFYRDLVVAASYHIGDSEKKGPDLGASGDPKLQKFYKAAVQLYLREMMDRASEWAYNADPNHNGSGYWNGFLTELGIATYLGSSDSIYGDGQRYLYTPERNIVVGEARSRVNGATPDPIQNFSTFVYDPGYGSVRAHGSIYVKDNKFP